MLRASIKKLGWLLKWSHTRMQPLSIIATYFQWIGLEVSNTKIPWKKSRQLIRGNYKALWGHFSLNRQKTSLLEIHEYKRFWDHLEFWINNVVMYLFIRYFYKWRENVVKLFPLAILKRFRRRAFGHVISYFHNFFHAYVDR
jgi:hypothetical protein